MGVPKGDVDGKAGGAQKNGQGQNHVDQNAALAVVDEVPDGSEIDEPVDLHVILPHADPSRPFRPADLRMNPAVSAARSEIMGK